MKHVRGGVVGDMKKQRDLPPEAFAGLVRFAETGGHVVRSGDALARDRRLPKIEEGDLLAVLNAGAYGFAMSSQYNARPRAAEVLVKNGKYTLVREREMFDDLLSGQRVAEWLK